MAARGVDALILLLLEQGKTKARAVERRRTTRRRGSRNRGTGCCLRLRLLLQRGGGAVVEEEQEGCGCRSSLLLPLLSVVLAARVGSWRICLWWFYGVRLRGKK